MSNRAAAMAASIRKIKKPSERDTDQENSEMSQLNDIYPNAEYQPMDEPKPKEEGEMGLAKGGRVHNGKSLAIAIGRKKMADGGAVEDPDKEVIFSSDTDDQIPSDEELTDQLKKRFNSEDRMDYSEGGMAEVAGMESLHPDDLDMPGDQAFLSAKMKPIPLNKAHYPDPNLKESEHPMDKKKAIAAAMEKLRLRHYHGK